MKIILALILSALLLVRAKSQSWLIESNHPNWYEDYNFPVELNDGNIFVCYLNVNKFKNDSISTWSRDSTDNWLQKRTSDGKLINTKRIYREDTAMYLANSQKFNENIILLYTCLVRRTRFDVDNIAIIMQLSPDLDIISENQIFLKDRELFGGQISIESDTTFIISFIAQSYLNSDEDSTYFIRFSNIGNIKNHRTVPHSLQPHLVKIINNLTKDSIIAIDENDDVYILDKDLNPRFVRKLKYRTTDIWASMTHYKNKYYLQLDTYIKGSGPSDIGLIKLNKDFDDIKIVQIGDSNVAKTPALGSFYNPKANNSIYMAGVRYPPPLDKFSNPLLISRLDTNLNVIWTKYYDDNHFRDFPTICATADDGILLAGYKEDLNDQVPIAYLLKIDSSGNFPTSTKNEGNNLLWSATVFPNPSPGYLQLELDKVNKDLFIEFFDINSNSVFHSKNLVAGKHTFDLNYLPNGIYFYSIIVDGMERGNGKWIKQ